MPEQSKADAFIDTHILERLFACCNLLCTSNKSSVQQHKRVYRECLAGIVAQMLWLTCFVYYRESMSASCDPFLDEYVHSQRGKRPEMPMLRQARRVAESKQACSPPPFPSAQASATVDDTPPGPWWGHHFSWCLHPFSPCPLLGNQARCVFNCLCARVTTPFDHSRQHKQKNRPLVAGGNSSAAFAASTILSFFFL